MLVQEWAKLKYNAFLLVQDLGHYILEIDNFWSIWANINIWVSTVWFLMVGNPFLRSNWRNSAVLMIPQFLSKLNNEVMVEHRNFEDLKIWRWWSIGWSPGRPKFSKVSETPIYGCLWYGFQGWRIHFWHQIIKIPMFNHHLIVQLWQNKRFHKCF